jgi:hypothetical protein
VIHESSLEGYAGLGCAADVAVRLLAGLDKDGKGDILV